MQPGETLITTRARAVLATLFPSDLHSALESRECSEAVNTWLSQATSFHAAMTGFNGSAAHALLIAQVAATYCDALAKLVERVAAIVAQQDGAAQVRH
jgi:poly(A) polymerase Pap1